MLYGDIIKSSTAREGEKKQAVRWEPTVRNWKLTHCVCNHLRESTVKSFWTAVLEIQLEFNENKAQKLRRQFTKKIEKAADRLLALRCSITSVEGDVYALKKKL